MTDTPLLRLARLMLRFVGNESSNDPDSLNLPAALSDLVRDLEAAESMRLRQADCSENEAPARRTITREEFNAAKTDLFAELVDGARTWAAATDKERMMCHNMATHCAYAWRLTVEDA